jgi:hypothetical protein
MAAVNKAYEFLERQRRRPGGPSPLVGVGPGKPGRRDGADASRAITNAPPRGSLLERVEQSRYRETPIIEFGEYAGWRVADVARVDPRYLRWLSRHSAGLRYRAAIAEVLGPDDEVGRRAAILR